MAYEYDADFHDSAAQPGEAHAGPDTTAAFTGLIVGALVLFLVLFGVVKVTTAHYEALEKAEAPAASS